MILGVKKCFPLKVISHSMLIRIGGVEDGRDGEGKGRFLGRCGKKVAAGIVCCFVSSFPVIAIGCFFCHAQSQDLCTSYK